MKQLKLSALLLFLVFTVQAQSVRIKWKQIQSGTTGQVAIVGVDGNGAWVTPTFLSWADTTAMLAGYVRTTRAITINGTTQDLSSNRTWTLTKADVGLGNADNTSDANKPVSTAQQTALNFKEDLANKATDLSANNNTKYPTVKAVQDALNAAASGAAGTYIPLAQRGAANGVATLDASGKIPNGQIPALALVETYVVNSQAAMLALSAAEMGDVAVRTDLSKSYILTNNAPGTLGSWQELLSPTITNSDQVPEGSTNLYYTDARARAALSAGVGISYNSSTGVITNAAPHIATNLGQGTTTTTTVPLTSSTGTGTTLVAATSSFAGIMTAADKIKLDGIAAGATANIGTVTSVGITAPTGLAVTGSPITTSGTINIGLATGYSIPTNVDQTTWMTAYDNMIVSAAVSGTTSKTATLTQRDGGTITYSWTDLQDAFTDEGVDATGSTSTSITLPHAPSIYKHLVVSLNGQILSAADWSVSGTTATLANITRETSDHIYFFYSY